MEYKSFLEDKVKVYSGDSRDVLKKLPDNSIDSIVTDPPYALVSIVNRFGKTTIDAETKTSEMARNRENPYSRASVGFMNKEWDTGETAFAVDFWAECFRVLKPGGYVLSFGATRSYHRLACAIEDAGFEIRDCIMWLYGTGFPKSHNISKAIDKRLGFEREKKKIEYGTNVLMGGLGVERPWKEKAKEVGYHEVASDEPISEEAKQWDGWGTSLKPAVEPIVMARKPLAENTIADNVLAYGTGAINIDGCRVEVEQADSIYDKNPNTKGGFGHANASIYGTSNGAPTYDPSKGRWPANLIHDGSEEVVKSFPTSKSGVAIQRNGGGQQIGGGNGIYSGSKGGPRPDIGFADEGSNSRFFYSAKASAKEKVGNHPTQKPIALMQYLCRLVTPKGGVVLDPFAGTGTTAEGGWREGFECILIEREDEYVQLIEQRMNTVEDRLDNNKKPAKLKNYSANLESFM